MLCRICKLQIELYKRFLEDVRYNYIKCNMTMSLKRLRASKILQKYQHVKILLCFKLGAQRKVSDKLHLAYYRYSAGIPRNVCALFVASSLALWQFYYSVAFRVCCWLIQMMSVISLAMHCSEATLCPKGVIM